LTFKNIVTKFESASETLVNKTHV